MAAYYRMVTDQGRVNGREIKFISYDDGYTPPKTAEMTRKLVEQDEVLAIASPLGTPTNSPTSHYMNQRKVPQLFVATGRHQMGRPKGPSLDDWLAAELPGRGPRLRGLH